MRRLGAGGSRSYLGRPRQLAGAFYAPARSSAMAVVIGEESAEVIVIEEMSRGLEDTRLNYETGGLTRQRTEPIMGLQSAEPFHHNEPDWGSETWRRSRERKRESVTT